MKESNELTQLKRSNEELKAQVEHYKLYLKAWQKSRALISDVVNDKNLSKEEKVAINTLFNTMTEGLKEVVKL